MIKANVNGLKARYVRFFLRAKRKNLEKKISFYSKNVGSRTPVSPPPRGAESKIPSSSKKNAQKQCNDGLCGPTSFWGNPPVCVFFFLKVFYILFSVK